MDPGSCLNDLQRGTHGVCRRMDGARDHAVGRVVVHHHGTEEHGIEHLLGRFLGRHALMLSELIELLCIFPKVGTVLIIHDFDARKRRDRGIREFFPVFRKQDDPAESFLRDHLRCLTDSGIIALREHDPRIFLFRPFLDTVNK